MEEILLEFVNTLDTLFKKLQEEAGNTKGISKLTVSQIQYIDGIHSLREPTITDVADKLGFTKASVTAGVNKLVEGGYVLKTQSQEDKRVFYLSLTPKAKKLVAVKYQALKEYGNFIKSALEEEEAKQFEAIITKLVKTFKQS